MDILNGIRNFLTFLNDNWTTIVVIIGLIVALYQKIKKFIGKSRDEKVNIAMTQIKEIILKVVAEAEDDYDGHNKGSIKRSQVINQIYEKYPVLSKVTDQQSLTDWIDNLIDDALATLKEISNKGG